MSWTYRRRVKYYETDRMGVVHHSNYLRFLEDARMDWIDDNVIKYSKLEEMGIVIPAVSANEEFLSFLRYDDPFAVRMQLTEFTGVRMKFYYEVSNTDTGILCLKAESTHCFTLNNPDYPPVSIKRKFPDVYEAFAKMIEKL